MAPAVRDIRLRHLDPDIFATSVYECIPSLPNWTGPSRCNFCLPTPAYHPCSVNSKKGDSSDLVVFKIGGSGPPNSDQNSENASSASSAISQFETKGRGADVVTNLMLVPTLREGRQTCQQLSFAYIAVAVQHLPGSHKCWSLNLTIIPLKSSSFTRNNNGQFNKRWNSRQSKMAVDQRYIFCRLQPHPLGIRSKTVKHPEGPSIVCNTRYKFIYCDATRAFEGNQIQN